MLKVVTADTIVESVNKLPTSQFYLEKPWWWWDTQANYNKRVEGQAVFNRNVIKKIDDAMAITGEVIDKTAEVIGDGSDFLDWLSKHWKIAIVGAIALLIFLRD